jgi:hypothetical protein
MAAFFLTRDAFSIDGKEPFSARFHGDIIRKMRIKGG